MVRYAEILFRFKSRFVFLLIVLPAMVGAVVILLFPSYKAISYLWVDDPSYFGGATPSGWSQYATPAQNESDGLSQLASTRAFGQDVYGRLASDIGPSDLRRQAVANAHLTIVPTGSHLLMVTAQCDQPWICLVVVNRSVEALREEQVQAEQNNAKAGSAYLTVQLQQAQQAQTAAQNALHQYLIAHPGLKVDTTDPATITDPQVGRLAADVQQANSHVNDVQNQLTRNNSVVSESTAVIQSEPRMVDPPVLTHGRPIGDGTGLKKGAIAGGVALAIGLVYLLLLSWVDKTLRDPREIEHRFKVPVVTTIPELQPSERF